MHEQLGESLSALMDGEADEADIQRILDKVEDPTLRETWRRLHMARASLHSRADMISLDVSGRIMAAIDAEPAQSGAGTASDAPLEESLSALMDGEAEEADIQRILDKVEDPALRATWSRYHNASASLHEQAGITHTDISAGVRAALQAEPAHTELSSVGAGASLDESLSALMDGEADEAELQRVLDNVDDPALRDTWRRYHSASASLQSLDGITGVDLSDRIMAAIESDAGSETAAAEDVEPAAVIEQIQPVGRFQRFVQPIASFAVAASVTAAVLLGSQYYGLLGTGAEVQVPSDAVAERGSPVTLLGGTATLAGYGYATPAPQETSPKPPVAKPEPAAPDYDAMARERLRRYMAPHAGEAALNASRGMMPYAKVATFETEE